MILKGEGTYCRMEVPRKYQTNHTSWIDQLTLHLSMWFQVPLFFFFTWPVPKFYYHWLFPRAERALALAGEQILACTEMNLHGTLLFSPSTFTGQPMLRSCSLFVQLPMVFSSSNTFPWQFGKRNLKHTGFVIKPLIVFTNHCPAFYSSTSL